MKRLLLILLLVLLVVLTACKQEVIHEVRVAGIIVDVDQSRTCKGLNCDYKTVLIVEYNGVEYTREFKRIFDYKVGDTYYLYIPKEEE